jgi:iron complex outermembrane recepter protein
MGRRTTRLQGEGIAMQRAFWVSGRVKQSLFVSVAAMAMAQAASAQEASSPPDEGIEDIIVTAQKREEPIQETPIAITALDQSMLNQAGIVNAEGLTAIVPNVGVRPFNNSIVIAARGVSNENTSNLGDPSLAFHINGVYVARPRGAASLFYDVERVELLRGPQGTLYGRNSTAGALNIITRRPDFDRFAVGADFSYGNYDAMTARGYINVPIADNFALRGAILYTERDGYSINNRRPPTVTTGGPPNVIAAANAFNAAFDFNSIESGDDDQEFAARLSLNYEPSDRLSWVLTAQYQETDEVGQIRTPIDTPGYFGTGGPFTTQFVLPQAQDPNNPRVISLNHQPYFRVQNWDITSEIRWEVNDGAELVMVSGYRRDDNDLSADTANYLNNATVRAFGYAEQWSNEVRLASTGNAPLQWLMGVYYSDEDQFDQALIRNIGPPPPGNVIGFPALNQISSNAELSSASYAAFGQLTYRATDALRLSGGLRWSRDNKRRFGFGVAAPGLTDVPNPLPPTALTYANNDTWTRINWRVGADYQFNDDVMAYVSASTGYRAGGFNNSNVLAFEPEDILAFEGGIKSDWLDRRLRLNLAGFYYRYEDLQVTAPRDVNGNIQAFTQNAANARIWGFEVEGVVRPASFLTVDFALGYLNAQFTDFVAIDNICTAAGLVTPPVQFRPGCVTRPVTVNGVTTFQLVPQNIAGNRLAGAPDLTVNVGATLTFFDNDAGSLTARGSIRLVGTSFMSEFNRSFDRVESHAQTDARLTYRAPGNRYHIEAYAQNIGNVTVPGSIAVTFAGATVAYLPPRTYGLRIGFDF